MQLLLAGNGFGSSSQLVSITSDSNETHQISDLSQRELTFVAPPSNGLSSRIFTLRVNNATQNLTVNYSEAAAARVDGIIGGHPINDGQMMLPATSAAALTVLGSGFVSTLATEVIVRLIQLHIEASANLP